MVKLTDPHRLTWFDKLFYGWTTFILLFSLLTGDWLWAAIFVVLLVGVGVMDYKTGKLDVYFKNRGPVK